MDIAINNQGFHMQISAPTVHDFTFRARFDKLPEDDGNILGVLPGRAGSGLAPDHAHRAPLQDIQEVPASVQGRSDPQAHG